MSAQKVEKGTDCELDKQTVCNPIGELDFYKRRDAVGETGVHCYGDICFTPLHISNTDFVGGNDYTGNVTTRIENAQRYTKEKSKNMDLLWKQFCKMNDFPDLYLRTVAKIALCKDPTTMREEHHDAIDIQIHNVGLIRTGDEITVINTRFRKETIFQRWDDRVFHKFKMRSGHYLFLRQDFIDCLTKEDKRYLCIGR